LLEFKLSVLPAHTDLNDAFAQLFDDKRSALAVEGANGDYRLVSFDHMTEALAHGATRLDQVHGRYLPGLERSPPCDRAEALRNTDATIGLISVDNGMAELFSISEGGGYPLIAASTVVRCDRPGLPAGRTPQSWYHYYPPNKTKPPKPHPCVAKGCPGFVR
jgi:hypothetical protein